MLKGGVRSPEMEEKRPNWSRQSRQSQETKKVETREKLPSSRHAPLYNSVLSRCIEEGRETEQLGAQ
jgi:hypothetical protein